MSKATRISILLDHEDYTEKEVDGIFDDLFDWLHDKVCGRDHGPNGDQGICRRDFFLSSQVERSEDE